MIPRPLTRDRARDVDRVAIETYGLPGIVLMENAGRNAAALVHALAGAGRPVAVACGRGNNAGDGFVIARHLENLGHPVRLATVCAIDDYAGDAGTNARVAVRAGQRIACLATGDQVAWETALAGADWIVDALLGTGATGPARGVIATAIAAINALRDRGGSRVFAVDLPSGLDCDTGTAAGACVRADVTGTFVAPKVGFDAAGAAAFTGGVRVLDIGVPRALLAALG